LICNHQLAVRFCQGAPKYQGFIVQIAITGLGIISSCGNQVNSFWDNIINGRSGMRPITKYVPKVIKTTRVGEVENFHLDPAFDARWINKTDLHIQFALNATKQALDQSGLEIGRLDPHRIQTIVGTTGGSYEFILKNQERIDNNKAALPNFISGHINNMPSAYINMHYGIHGGGLGISGACAAGNQSIAVAAMMIETGQADVVICGASDAWLSELTISGFESIGALSYADILPRPYDKNRDGFAISEGAGIIILESEEHAFARNAEVLAYLSGYGISSDAHHPTSPHPTGEPFIRMMRDMLFRAKLNADVIDYINAHATATPIGDVAECRAFAQVFGTKPFISSTKSMTGHSIGSTSAIEAVISVMALHTQTLPATINLTEIDPECVGNHVTETINHKTKHILSNSFGFGGTNGALIFSQA
jgi:3-oxoacyl-[acyl-carrier-protein] synthase II